MTPVSLSIQGIYYAEIFVAVLGASNYTYVEACASQSIVDWIKAHCHALEFFKGVPRCIIPDNLKAGVSKAHRYDPDIHSTYQELAHHYGCAIVPARAYHPKDKPKVSMLLLRGLKKGLCPFKSPRYLIREFTK